LLYLRSGELIGVDAVNLPAEYLAARKAIAARGEVPTSASGACAIPAPDPTPA
jgi:hypothetical protein